MGRGGRGENKGAFPTPLHKPLRCPAWHKWKLRFLIFDLPSSVKLPQSQRICQMWGMCYTFNKKYYWYFYFCVIHDTLKSCNFHLWQISLTKLSLLALMPFVQHRRQQISLTARYSLDIHSIPAPPFLNIIPAVASCVGTAVSTNSLPVYKTI